MYLRETAAWPQLSETALVQQTASSLLNPLQSTFEQLLKAIQILISAGKDLSINLIQLLIKKLNLVSLAWVGWLVCLFSLLQEQQWIGPNKGVAGVGMRHPI